MLILKIKDESSEGSPHPPYAPAHGSLLTLILGTFTLLAHIPVSFGFFFFFFFGDSEFQEGKNHDFPSFSSWYFAGETPQQIDEWMSG